MIQLGRLWFGRSAALLPLLFALSACLLAPGKFTSTLDVHRDRSFTFTYVGEVYAPPPSSSIDEDKAKDTGTTQSLNSDSGRAVMMKAAATKDGGGTPAPAIPAPKPEDEAKMRALAETLSKEYGYRSVRYMGNYRFLIDYQISGKLTHSFLFPFNIDGEVLVPFLAIELRGKDRIRLRAPGYANQESKGLPGMGDMGGASGMPGANAMDGTFTLTTDGEVISQNQENGTATLPDGRKRISWRATPQTSDAPTAVLKLDALP
jgi:hypothetical protein